LKEANSIITCDFVLIWDLVKLIHEQHHATGDGFERRRHRAVI
jgi:hypothetical protein